MHSLHEDSTTEASDMLLYIKEWPNHSATIMTDNGQVIWTFSSTEEAHQACKDWHNLVAGEPVIVMSSEPPESDSIPSAA